MFKKVSNASIAVICFLLSSCGAYFNQPLTVSNAVLGEPTPNTKRLVNLPEPKDPVVVGVYNFRDQTGQYKLQENGSSFSTAITQGATTILLKALEDSKWFRVIERENLNNLLNERNIIRSTRQEYRKTSNPNEPQLPPLLYAGVLLEGGVISYDSNIVTGGIGARYFGVGGSSRYRQDRISIYLRAISTSSGEVLKTVYVSKTILFQAIDASLFRYVNFQRLLEAETGITKNEPVHMAITEAIEKAVEAMVIEGVEDGLWLAKDNAIAQETIKSYEAEKEEASYRKIYDRIYKEKRGKNVFEIGGGATIFRSDYPKTKVELMAIQGGYKRYLTPYFNLGVNYAKYNLANKDVPAFQSTFGYMSFDLKAEVNLLPYDDLSPYLFTSAGYNVSNYFKDNHPKIEYGVGLEYLLSEKVGMNLYGGYNIVFNDELDQVAAGKRDDHFLRFGAGLNFYLFNKKKKKGSKKITEKLDISNPIKVAEEVSNKGSISKRELRKLRRQNRKSLRKNSN
ncbi:CsgG/HfaB family protein [Pseudofulvibacter geojedonensis]|uniref:CsgG/HfaB family protein n=1 Tax=Pseudofulvibacter geojedonensis TaxID=1123758 RepID=A0ABW3I2Q2_9FLAO